MMKKSRKPRKNSQFSIILRQLVKNRLAVIGFFILLVVVLSAVFAGYLAPYPYAEQDLLHTLQGPSSEHWMGTDNLGRDLFSRLLYGGRISLIIGFCATLLAAFLGMAIGIISGYFGGKVDVLLMRFVDIYTCIPSLVMAIALSAVLGVGVVNSILAIGISNMGGFARMMRIQFLAVRDKEYVEAARATNASDLKIIFQYMLPNAIAPLIVNITMSIGIFIMQAASLSFIGLGAQPPVPEWGAILSEGRKYMRGHMYLVLFPGICIMLTILSCNLFGDGLRDALDPRLRD